MPERFEPVPDKDTVFRLVDENSSFLPAGLQLPLPAWFSPSTKDIEEGARRNRPPGWSMWNQSIATVQQVKEVVGRPASLAFGIEAGVVRAIGKKHERALGVLADPAEEYKPKAGWDAHCVLEGLLRPNGLQKSLQKDLQAELASSCAALR